MWKLRKVADTNLQSLSKLFSNNQQNELLVELKEISLFTVFYLRCIMNTAPLQLEASSLCVNTGQPPAATNHLSVVLNLTKYFCHY